MSKDIKEYEKKYRKLHRTNRLKFFVVFVLAICTAITVGVSLRQTGIAETADVQCGLEEHTHSDECYSTTSVLICTNEDEGHVHDETCYTTETVLTCSKEEHTHSVACYSDTTADVEDETIWNTFASTDLVTVARSQIGYTESTANFSLVDGVKKGYTRYGDWYGAPYSDWDSTFVAFCLHYAGYTDYPTNLGANALSVSLNENGYYQTKDIYTPKASDLAFFDNNGDSTIDHVGIVSQLNEDNTILVVEGDVNDVVVENTYTLDNETLVGYGVVPVHETTEQEEQTPDVEEYESYTYTEDVETYANDEIMPVADETTSTGVDMNGYITSASFQKKNGVIWEESTEFTTSDQVRGTINFENVYTSTIKNNGNTLYIDLPAYINCSGFTGTYDTYDGSTHSGKYTYEKNADGTYRIKLVLDEDYVNNAGDTIGGSLQFNFQWTKDAVPDSGTKKVEIGNWSGDLTIKEDTSGDDKPSSANYSIYKQAGSLQIDSNGYAYIDYTVTLTVKNGMTAPINMKDVLTGEGFTYDSTISVTGGDVKVNFGSTEGQGTSTQIQLWPNSGSTVDPGTYTIKYRVKSLNSVTDPSTTVPSEVKNSITVPEKGDDSISSETHTSTTSGIINKQGQLVSGTDATYIDYTVYLNAGAIIKNLKTPANFTDTLPDTLELQGDVTVKQYDVTGTLQNTTTATVNGQNISYTTPTGQYYYVITYRTKVKDSELPIGGSVTIKNDGKSTGGVDGSSSSEITVTNHKLTKSLTSGSTNKDESGNLIRTSNWKSNVSVKGDLEGYVYEDYSSLYDDTTVEAGKSKAMNLVANSVVVKDASGNVVSSELYTLEDSTHTTSTWSSQLSQNVKIQDGLFKITFKKGVTGPVTIEYQTTTDISKLTYGYVINYAELSKDGHTDRTQGQDTFDLIQNNNGLIHKKKDVYQWDDTSGTTTLKPGENSIPWVILVNRDHTMSSDFTVTDTLKDDLIFLEDTFDISINGNSIKNNEGVTWSYDKETGKLTVSVKESAYRAENQNFTHQSVTISFRTQLPDNVIKGNQTTITYKNTASLETNGSITDSTYEQKVIREVVGKSGSYDKNTHILSYNVVINPDGSTLNSGNTLTVTDTLDAGSIADYVSLQSLEVFTALKTTDASGNVKIEPGTLVKTLTKDDSGSTEFTYTLDSTGKSFTTYLPDRNAYVIVAKYYVDTDVTEAVQMKNTVQIDGHDDWKKEDSSTKVEANTSGETHTNKVTVVKHDTAQYSTLLSGASFELDKYENDTWTKVGDATTGSDGKASINPVSFNTLYKLGETQAPDGYVLDEGPTYFIVATTGTSEADAKKDLPDSITGDDKYSKDAVKVYYAKNSSNDYINIEIDRYNSKDTTKVNPGELRVNKVWVDSKGQTVTDATELAKMSEVSVTLTKHVANKGHTVYIAKADGTYPIAFATNVNDGAYIYISGWQSVYDNWTAAGASLEKVGTVSQTDNTPLYKYGPITTDVTLKNDNLSSYYGTFVKQEGGTQPSGTTDTVIGTVTLNSANEWTYLWTNLDRSDGVTYTITETTVDGYTTTYKIDGSDLEAGKTFTPSEKGDKVTVTNTAYPEYDLPMTGGSGTQMYVFTGSLLIMSALLLSLYKNIKRRDERRQI